MEDIRPLTPCLIGSGTLANPRDMIRALETLEAVDYVYEVDGAVIDEGPATLVKLMFDSESSTIVVNSCLFLNVSSFRYLDFSTEDEIAVVQLFGDGTTLTLRTDPSREVEDLPRGQLRLIETPAFDLEPYLLGDDEDDEE